MRQAILEVERKFCGLAIPRLTIHAGTPAFLSLRYLGEQSFKDIYYDKHHKLSSSGVWIRKRQFGSQNAVWEAKIRQGGTFNNSMFEELTNTEAIARCVLDITGHDETASSDFGLGIVAQFCTQRKSWLADDQFKIVLDSMDFGHEVGEVELERKYKLPQCQDPAFMVEAWKRKITQEMDRQIEEFMKHYHWAFLPGTPRGKLTAFFEREQH